MIGDATPTASQSHQALCGPRCFDALFYSFGSCWSLVGCQEAGGLPGGPLEPSSNALRLSVRISGGPNLE